MLPRCAGCRIGKIPVSLHGHPYEVVKEGLLSERIWLRNARNGEIVLCCQHAVGSVSFYRGRSDDLLFQLVDGSAFEDCARLERSGQEIGRLIRVTDGRSSPSVLAVQGPEPTTLALCFVLLSRP